MGFRRNDHRTFRRDVKSLAYERAAGHCQKCGAPLMIGNYQYDHVIPWELCHDSSLANCEVLCCPCHLNKSRLDAKILAKSDRQRDKHRGAVNKPSRPLPGGRDSGQSKTISGRVVERRSQGEKLRMTLQERNFEEK